MIKIVRTLVPCWLTAVSLLASACGGDEARDMAAFRDDDTYNIVEEEDLEAAWDCRWPGCCIGEYVEFLDLAAPHADPISGQELFQQIRDVENGRVDALTDPISEDVLGETILDVLNIRFLRDGINDRLLRVTTVRKEETPQYEQRELLFEDPYVGKFQGLLLSPKGDGPFPGIIAIHGHRDDADRYKKRYHGKEYPARGYVILMLTMRAMAIDLCEHHVSRLFLRKGFTLVGIRSYETLVGLKYLRYLPNVIHDRIGLIGHSGGSTASNLTVRIEKGFRAYVSDLTIDYCEWGTLFEPFHCETVPQLYPYHLRVNDFETSPVPIKRVPYGYTNGMDEIFRFFDDHLKD